MTDLEKNLFMKVFFFICLRHDEGKKIFYNVTFFTLYMKKAVSQIL